MNLSLITYYQLNVSNKSCTIFDFNYICDNIKMHFSEIITYLSNKHGLKIFKVYRKAYQI